MSDYYNVSNTSGFTSAQPGLRDLSSGGGMGLPPPPPGGPGYPITPLFNQAPGFDLVVSSPLDFNFTGVLHEALSKANFFSSLAGEFAAFNVSKHYPLESERFTQSKDAFPLGEVNIQLYMFGMAGTPASSTADRKSELIDEDLFDPRAPDAEEKAQAAEAEVKLRPKKKKTKEQHRQSAQRLSLLTGAEPNDPLLQQLSLHVDVGEADTDEVVLERVATLYGMPVDIVRQLLQAGKTLRATVIEHYGITAEERDEALNQLQWAAADGAAAADAGPLPAAIQEQFGLADSEVEEFNAGLQVLGLSPSDLASVGEIVLEKANDNELVLQILCQKAMALFDEGHTGVFFNFLQKLHDFENQRRAIIRSNGIELAKLRAEPKSSETEDQMAVLGSANENLAFTFHTDVVVALVTHVSAQIQGGVSYFESELFFNLMAHPQYARPFSRLEVQDVNQITAHLAEGLQKKLQAELREIALQAKAQLKQVTCELERTQKKELQDRKKVEYTDSDPLYVEARSVDFRKENSEVPPHFYKRYQELKESKLHQLAGSAGGDKEGAAVEDLERVIHNQVTMELYKLWRAQRERDKPERHANEVQAAFKPIAMEAQTKRQALIRAYLAKAKSA